MPDIIRITIAGTSRSCRDRLTLRPDAVRYACRPAEAGGTARKWTYTTSSPAFQSLFREAAAAALEILKRDDLPYVTGPGAVSVAVTFADRRVLKWNYYPSYVSFRECFDTVRRMIPPCEEEPVMFRLADPGGARGGAAQ